MTEATVNQSNSLNSLNTNTTTTQSQVMTEEKKATKKAKDSEFGNIKVVEAPVRQLPKLITELLDKDFNIILSKNGYYVEGFYGLSTSKDKVGYAFGQETTEPNTLMFYDAKGHKHLIKSFEDLVKFNSQIWGVFYKVADEYKKPSAKWFNYMLELGALNITPSAK